MFRDEFQAEIDYLVQLCEELGEQQPALAPILGRGADLQVSRLVEGLAFSFARLRQRLNDDLPEVIHPIIDNLCPELLRPIPSGTIVELSPSTRISSKQTVSAGSSFGSRSVDGTSCTFRSIVDCEVSPWSLRGVELDAGRRTLRLMIDMFEGAELAAAAPKALRLFLAQPLAVALEARSFLLRKTSEVIVRSTETNATVVLDRPIASPRSSAPIAGEQALVPIADAFLSLREYFVFPHRSAFVELPSFDAVAELGAGVRRFEITLAFSEPAPKGIAFDASSILLHAVPAVNVFHVPKLTIPLTGDRRRCHLRFGSELRDAEVYAVQGVSLVSKGLRSTPIEPWARFFPPHLAAASGDVRYELIRTPSILGARFDVSVAFSGADVFLADKTDAELNVFATNGERAASVGLGDVRLPMAGSPPSVSFRNVTPVTRSAAPSVAGDRLWRSFRVMKANVATLADGDALGALLASANVPAFERWPDAKPDADCFVPLLAAILRPRHAPKGSELDAGATIVLRLDTRRFAGPGDVYLFGERLASLFAAAANTSEWVEVVLEDASGALIAEYPRRYGVRLGL